MKRFLSICGALSVSLFLVACVSNQPVKGPTPGTITAQQVQSFSRQASPPPKPPVRGMAPVYTPQTSY